MLGVLTMGVPVSEAGIVAGARIPRIILTSAAVAAVGLLVAWTVGRYLDRVTLGRGPEEIAQQFLLAETAMDSLEAGLVVLSPAGRVRLFERGWSTKPAGAAGRGMGLWLTRRIAEEAGGVAEVATDSGTVFTVEVPPAAEPEAGTA